MGKLREIERLRGLAILLVVYCHWATFLPLYLHDTWSGVDLFFVISGFVICRSFLDSIPNFENTPLFLDRLKLAAKPIKYFYIKRAYRIIPLAALIAIFFWAFETVTYYLGLQGTVEPLKLSKEMVGLLSGFYNYTFKTMHTNHLSIYWSLYVEEHFYLLFPFLMVAFPTKNKRIAASLAIVAGIALIVRPLTFALHSGNLSWFEGRAPTHLRIDAILIGVFLGLTYKQLGNFFSINGKFLSLVLVPFAIGILWFAPFLMERRFINTPLISLWCAGGMLVLFASWDRGIVLQAPVLSRALEYLGSRSYALYLSHQVIYKMINQVFFPDNASFHPFVGFRLLTILVTTLLVTEALHRWVEKPFIRRGAARIRKLMDDENQLPSIDLNGRPETKKAS